MTRISVCMATYNGERFIREQMQSILEQLLPRDEVIVSDDSSSDRTLEIVRSFNDNRVRILEGQTFRNPIGNFGNALAHSKGDYIFLADQDDVWLPGRVEKLVAGLVRYDLVVNDCVVVDENLKTLIPSYFESVKASHGIFRNMVRTSSYVGCCMAFRRKVLELATPFPPKIAMHDFWIAMIAEARFSVLFIREPLLLYRRHGSNLSFTTQGSKNSLSKRISFRINTLLPLFLRLLR